MYHRRLKTLAILFVVAIVTVTGKLAYLQICKADYYRQRASSSCLRERLLATSRGNICDRQGRHLAYDDLCFDLHVRLDHLHSLADPVSYLSELAHLLGTSEQELEDDLVHCQQEIDRRLARVPEKRRKRERRYLLAQPQLLRPGLSFAQMAALESQRETLTELALKDKSPSWRQRASSLVELCPTMKRIYPAGESACHLVGYLALPKLDWRKLTREHQELKHKYHLDPGRHKDEYLLSLMLGDFVGASGLELQYEKLLRGKRGLARELVNVRGVVQQTLYRCEPVPGSDLHLTLDLEMQQVAEKALGENLGAVVLLDPRDGGVLALASFPRFNPNTFQEDFKQLQQDHRRPLVQRAFQEYYQPGSIFKVVDAAAALESGALTPSTSIYCRGSMLIGNRIFSCWRSHGAVQLYQALQQSCNVYFYTAAQRTGASTLLKWARLFGLGAPTGIDLPYEKPGGLPVAATPGDLANLAIGQGRIQVTPLQMARMMAVVANGGYVVTPHLRKDAPSVPLRKLTLRPEHLDALHEGLKAVVETRSGTGWQAHVPEVTTAGKTGTAQTGRPGIHHAWFVGFAPFENPRMVLVIVVENTPGSGGDTAAPIAGEIVREVVSRGLLD